MSEHPYASSPTPEPAAADITSFRDEYRFLSNFAFVKGGIRLGEMVGPTVEHLFQAAKTFDADQRASLLAIPHPGAVKQAGRRVTLRADWERVKLSVMAQLQASKYTQPELAVALLATGDARLVEGNHWCDTYWGVCTCRKHDGEGENWLGRILMIQRSFLVATAQRGPAA